VPQAFLVKGDSPRTHAQLKKKHYENKSNFRFGLLNRTARRDGAKAGFAKYIILTLDGREQVTVFAFHVQHADVFAYVKRECPEIGTVSAGFFFEGKDAFWHGGESESLSLKSRPQDGGLVRAFLSSPDREQWDLLALTPKGGIQ
jgi:hypothetical protein